MGCVCGSDGTQIYMIGMIGNDKCDECANVINVLAGRRV